MADELLTIAVDGEKFTMDDLSFRERREVRRLTREIAEDPDIELEDALVDDLLVAFVTVCKQRTNPDFTTDDAMDLKPADLEVDETPDPPTRPRTVSARGKAAAK